MTERVKVNTVVLARGKDFGPRQWHITSHKIDCPQSKSNKCGIRLATKVNCSDIINVKILPVLGGSNNFGVITEVIYPCLLRRRTNEAASLEVR